MDPVMTNFKKNGIKNWKSKAKIEYNVRNCKTLGLKGLIKFIKIEITPQKSLILLFISTLNNKLILERSHLNSLIFRLIH